MKCPNCGNKKVHTTTTHPPGRSGMVRRRKTCAKCRRSFTTVEIWVSEQEASDQIMDSIAVGRARHGRNLLSGQKLAPVDNTEAL